MNTEPGPADTSGGDDTIAAAANATLTEPTMALSAAALTEAASEAAGRALAKVFDAEARTALNEALTQAAPGARPAHWDSTAEQADTWHAQVQAAVREATWEALTASVGTDEQGERYQQGGGGGATTDEEGDEDEPAPFYEFVSEFVEDFLAPTIERKLVGSGRGLTWCPQWWVHPEAIARLMAMWEAWETLRGDGGTAMSSWWSAHCDHHLGVLMNGESGPLNLCTPTEHGGFTGGLRVEPAPAGLWDAAPGR